MHNLEKIIIALMFFFASGLDSYSQEYGYKHYTVLDGLAQNQVCTLYQDKDGFIWVGTKAGVSRYDGVHFKNIPFSQGIPRGVIERFGEWHNVLFCFATHECCYFDGKLFKKLFEYEDIPGHYRLNSDSSVVFLVKKNKIFKFYNNRFSLIKGQNKSYHIRDYAIIPGTDRILIAAKEGIHLLDGENEVTKISDLKCHVITPYKNKLCLLANSYENKSNAGLYFFEQDKLKRFFYDKTVTFNDASLINDQNSFIFQSGEKSWCKADTSGNITDSGNIPGILLSAMLKDKENLLWFGDESGLFMTNSLTIRNYTSQSGMPEYIWSIAESADSTLYFAGFLGDLAASSNNNNTIERLNVSKYVATNNTIYMSGIKNKNGEVVLPVDPQKLIFLKKNSVRCVYLPFYPEDSSYVAMSIYEDTSKGIYYLGTTVGLIFYYPENNVFRRIKTNDKNYLCIEKDKFGRIWACNSKGVVLCKDTTVVDFNKDEMPVNMGFCSCKKDKYGNMWLSGKNGLYLYCYDKMFRLTTQPVFFINMYKDDHVIAGGVNGFAYIDIDKFYKGVPDCYTYFDKTNGFLGIECGQNGTCVDHDGNVWIPASDRVVKFIPSRLKKNTLAPPVFIYTFETAEKNLKWNTVISGAYKTDTLDSVRWYQDNIRITYQAITFACPERTRYKIRLLGYDDCWSEAITESTATYTNLPPGNYTFEAIACNADGVWSTTPARIHFRIIPAFWQTVFFKILVAVLIILIIILIIYFYLRNRKNKEIAKRKIENELISMQITTINAQLDPHFIFNVITAIGTDIQEKNTDEAYRYFVKVSNLLRSSISNTSAIVRSLGDELEFVKNYLIIQKYRFGDKLTYEVAVEDNIDFSQFVPKMCIQVFVENAIKHGLENMKANGRISVSLKYEQNNLLAEITDNGIGRRASASYNTRSTGIGLKVFADFYAIINKLNKSKAGFEITDLLDADQNPAGTKVLLTIPIDFSFTMLYR